MSRHPTNENRTAHPTNTENLTTTEIGLNTDDQLHLYTSERVIRARAASQTARAIGAGDHLALCIPLHLIGENEYDSTTLFIFGDRDDDTAHVEMRADGEIAERERVLNFEVVSDE